jgi:hypothetical protein
MPTFPLVLFTVALFAIFGGSALPQEFSADLIAIDSNGQTKTGKLNVSHGRVRIETPEVTTGFFIFAGNAAYFVRPAQRVFMDAKQSSLLAQILVPVDPQSPCRSWQAMAVISGAADNGAQWRCIRRDEAMLGERSTGLFTAVSPRRHTYSVWIDKKYSFPIRLRADDGSDYRLEQIYEGVQDPTLFTVPPDYAKFDPRALIEHLKQSDVWVEPTQ